MRQDKELTLYLAQLLPVILNCNLAPLTAALLVNFYTVFPSIPYISLLFPPCPTFLSLHLSNAYSLSFTISCLTFSNSSYLFSSISFYLFYISYCYCFLFSSFNLINSLYCIRLSSSSFCFRSYSCLSLLIASSFSLRLSSSLF